MVSCRFNGVVALFLLIREHLGGIRCGKNLKYRFISLTAKVRIVILRGSFRPAGRGEVG